MLKAARLIDGRGGAPLAPAMVVIEGDRISAVGSNLSVPDGAKVIELGSATHIMAFEGDSYVHWFAGNYSSYMEDYHRRKGKDADQPHRIKYRRLTR